ncbi:hypothetical protein KIM372_06260 [Bombiscardovia nodaiensis]|uniref:Uncharacterized protein n=1 Tax=Bombiscardovia nodaiensis TaxID=2932181 RepID=A0ABM8B773_9BIFI|nr:hypothetical protein KIM372_06260 [Bombiscardovia nodaiensis]
MQEYVGQGFLPGASEEGVRLVRAHEGQIRERVVSFMRQRWHVEVRVNAVWPGRRSAAVYVSCQDPVFTVGLNVRLDREGQVVGDPVDQWEELQTAVMTGLFYRAYQGEYDQLNEFLRGEASRLGLYGMRPEALQRTQSVGYVTPWMFVAMAGSDYQDVVDAFVAGEDLPVERLRVMFEADIAREREHVLDRERGMVVNTPIQLYAASDTLPSKSVVDRVEADLRAWSGSHVLPPTGYTITIFKNSIVNRVGLPNGDNVDTGQVPGGPADGIKIRYLYFNGTE